MLTSRDEAHTTAVLRLRLSPRGTKPLYDTSDGREGSCNMSTAPFISQERRHNGWRRTAVKVLASS